MASSDAATAAAQRRRPGDQQLRYQLQSKPDTGINNCDGANACVALPQPLYYGATCRFAGGATPEDEEDAAGAGDGRFVGMAFGIGRSLPCSLKWRARTFLFAGLAMRH